MGDIFLTYIQYLELIAFFSGYPLLYAVINALGDSFKKNSWLQLSMKLLPISYALTGLLYLGLQLKNFYPDYSLHRLQQSITLPWLTLWGILSILFFFPSLARKKQFSLLHSLVFLFLLVKNFYTQYTADVKDFNMVKNDMKLYAASIILNFAALVVVILFSFLLKGRKHQTLT